ncbi:MFS transporter [Ancylomarina euxinus]|uniref:MFS transporter n=1 Tax=Ancylomarina euxinus TaxID=2283627 RepID=A0A425Y425_9BACT|nr:sugar porter family MFS transporter [Ancylomarina euxinus]MCZ4694633.1 sugar porter family MFS transporter [Ancylomarina euxinus]MUP14176.1 sugar porter family MFS transporter [Ancylomarina euxinus]RRG23030.1 MFS transporter [Ancylomarina euxinus]
MNLRYTIFVSFIVALGGFLMGFDASVISGVVKFIEPQFDLTKIQLGWAVSCLTLTATLAMFLAGPLSDKLGRRTVLKYAAALYFISAIGSAIAPSFWFLVLARMVGGFGVGASLIIAPIYIAEIAPSKMRGTMVSLNQLNIVLGISVAFFTNYMILQLGKSNTGWAEMLQFNNYNWRWMLGLEALPAIIYFIFLFFVPRSPRWLAMNGLDNEALQVMAKSLGAEEAKLQLKSISQSIKASSQKEKTSLKELFKPSMKLVLLIGIVIAVTQQITGINSVFFYAPMIFEQTGIGTDASFSQAILVGLINLVFTLFAIGLVDRIGRKPLLIFGLTGIAISMFILSTGFSKATYQLTEDKIQACESFVDIEHLSSMQNVVYYSDLDFNKALRNSVSEKAFKEHQTDFISKAISINPWLVLIGILGFVASFAISIGPVMWVLFSELFPNRIRGLAISFVGLINSGISFLVQLVFPWEQMNFGNATTFLIYGIFGALGLVFVFFMLPETKGKSLEELELILVKE